MDSDFIIGAGILSFAMAVAVGALAEKKGRPVGPWFFYGFFIWPVALIHVLLIEPSKEVADLRALADGKGRKCPACAEIIRNEAIKCRFCGTDVPPIVPALR